MISHLNLETRGKVQWNTYGILENFMIFCHYINKIKGPITYQGQFIYLDPNVYSTNFKEYIGKLEKICRKKTQKI